jgi:cyclopropane fatty-acyl-phospholipid synthase-like methyltransferase
MKGRHKYVTDDDALHLGGNIASGDKCTYCTSSWKYIIDKFNIKTAIDIGSGMGHAAKFISEHGVNITAVDGLEKNVLNSLVPAIQHDLTVGPLKHDRVNFVNCIEVVEHIEEKYLDNLMDSLTLGDYVLITHAIPGQRGWHHVNCQPSEYWINHFSNRGFKLLEQDSSTVQDLAGKDGAIHIQINGMVFTNQ